MQAFSSSGERKLLLAAVCRLTAVASPVAEHRLQSVGSVVVACGPSCYVARGIFPD